MNQHSKLRQSQEQGSEEIKQTQNTPQAKEFSSVEEMLRFDAAQNPPPPGLAQRINESVNNEPKRAPSLWQRLKQVLSKKK